MNDSKESIIRFIKEYQKKNQWAPTVREIGEGVYLSPSTVHGHLKNLVKAKRIIYKGVRQIRVLDREGDDAIAK